MAIKTGNAQKRLRRFARNERGAQLAEIAIVLPIFLALLAAAAEFGRYFYTYTTLSKATRVAARYITARPFNPNNPTDPNNTIAQAKKLAICGRTDTCSSGSEIIGGLAASNINITSAGGTIFYPETITVEIVSFNYQSIFNLSNFTGSGSWTTVPVTPSTKMRYMLSN